jgi:hypothetical protein
VGIATFNCFPIGAGIAVVRYRLLDIDVVINCTLVYGILMGYLPSSISAAWQRAKRYSAL